MEKKKEKILITDIFINGAKKGWNVAIGSMLPNIIMAFIIIYVLTTSGLLKFIGSYSGFLMAPLELPGEAITVILAAFLSWGGSAGVVVALFSSGAITVENIAVLLPGIALVGSTIQYMGRLLGVLEISASHYPILFLICIINSYGAMFVMKFLI